MQLFYSDNRTWNIEIVGHSNNGASDNGDSTFQSITSLFRLRQRCSRFNRRSPVFDFCDIRSGRFANGGSDVSTLCRSAGNMDIFGSLEITSPVAVTLRVEYLFHISFRPVFRYFVRSLLYTWRCLCRAIVMAKVFHTRSLFLLDWRFSYGVSIHNPIDAHSICMTGISAAIFPFRKRVLQPIKRFYGLLTIVGQKNISISLFLI